VFLQRKVTVVILYLSANAAMLMAMSLKGKQKAMKAAPAKKPLIRIAVVESDPMRFAGFRALLDSEPDFELISASLTDIGAQQNIDLLLLGNHHGQNLLDVMSCLKAPRSQLRIIVTGSGMDEQTILTAMAAGAQGYVDAAASPADFVQAIRIVSRGSVWAPRRVLSMFIERISNAPRRIFPADQVVFTDRETQVLKMLVEGRSNKEIGVPLGIRERTVKAHVAKLMRKVGVENRVALTVHAITHSLVSPRTEGFGERIAAPSTPANSSDLTTGAIGSGIPPMTNTAHQPKNNATDRLAEMR
jgi:DNA-binding NarL/FixJ family response regulator